MRVSISKPCSKNWDQMKSAGDAARFCASCQKCVMDFSTATDKEIISKLKDLKGEVCGKFSDAQLNRVLGNQIGKPKNYWSAFFSMIFTSIVGLQTPLSAQSKIQTEIVSTDTLKTLTPIGFNVQDLTV